MRKIIKKRKFRPAKQFMNRPLIISVMLVCGMLGLYFLISVFASSPHVSVEPENGSESGSVCSGSDSQASNGGYVQFGNCNLVTVPDQRNAVDPNKVIDPSGVKDSTAGLQAFLNGIPDGTLGHNTTVFFPKGALYRVNGGVTANNNFVTYTTDATNPAKLFSDPGQGPQAYPYRVKPLDTNTDAKQAAWGMDIFNDLDNHSPGGSKSGNGATSGGFDGRVNSTDLSLSSYFNTPFDQGDVGKSIVIGEPLIGYFRKTITAVSTDGKTVSWDTPDGVIGQSSNGNLSWAISPHNWECVFTPNPSYDLTTFSTDGHDYENALDCAIRANRGRVILTLKGNYNQWLNIELKGSNTAWQQPVLNFEASDPAVNEFQADLDLGGSQNEVSTKINSSWGDGIYLDNANHLWLHDSQITNVGRQGIAATTSNYQVIIENNVIQRTHHSLIDFEPFQNAPASGAKYTEDWFSLLNNTFGGPNAISATPQGTFGHIKFDGNHSGTSDVNSGTISQVVGWLRGASWGSQQDWPNNPGYIIFTNNDSHATTNTNPLEFTRLTHIYVANNDIKFSGGAYFTNFTNGSDFYKVENNTEICTLSAGNCDMLGQVDPTSSPSGSFSMPGTADADSWWTANGPTPQNYYHDSQN